MCRNIGSISGYASPRNLPKGSPVTRTGLLKLYPNCFVLQLYKMLVDCQVPISRQTNHNCNIKTFLSRHSLVFNGICSAHRSVSFYPYRIKSSIRLENVLNGATYGARTRSLLLGKETFRQIELMLHMVPKMGLEPIHQR